MSWEGFGSDRANGGEGDALGLHSWATPTRLTLRGLDARSAGIRQGPPPLGVRVTVHEHGMAL